MRARRTMTAVMCVLAALWLAACGSGGQSHPSDNNDAVRQAVLAAVDRAESVEVKGSSSGFARGLLIEAVVAGAEPLAADDLESLVLAARDASSRDPDYYRLRASTSARVVVDLTAAADELGLDWASYPDGISLTSTVVDEKYGPRTER
ncbi:MAG: hypothetical protein QM611_01425 [Microbacterium sp.]|uniref:hypothetical protein n=1 Tax=Microbacterium sp. TaxID=51671 RepID=UPI0039E2B34E